MGRAPRLPIDVIIPKPEKSYNNEDEYVTETLRRFECMFAAMKKKAEDTFRRNARLYTGNTEEFKVDDLVWVFSKRKVTGKPTKITDAWLGPYKVVGKPAEVLLQVKPAETDGRTITVHITTVRRYHPCGFGNVKHRPPREPVEEQEGDELQEELGRPERWMEPKDNLVVPVQVHASAHAEHEIQDLDRMQAGPSGVVPRRPVGRPPKGDKRPRIVTSDTDEDAPRKEGRHQGEKRVLSDENAPRKEGRYQGEKRILSDDESKPTKRWQNIAEDADDSDNHIAQIEDGDKSVFIPGDAKPPDKAGSGWIFSANQSLTIQPGTTAAVDLGLRAILPPCTTLILLSRPKHANQGIVTSGHYNATENQQAITVNIYNSTTVPRRIQKGAKIAIGYIFQNVSVTWKSGIDDPN